MPRDENTEQGPDVSHRRIEEWVASNLDASEFAAREDVDAALAVRLRPPGSGSSGHRGPTVRRRAPVDWGRFRLVRKGEVAVIRLVDRNLTKVADLRELESDLIGLVESGCDRIVLNFAEVERLSSWVVGMVINAHQRCRKVDGGGLKVCGLRPDVSAVLTVAGVGDEVTVVADEATAVSGPWPGRRGPRPLPAAVVSALSGSAGFFAIVDPADQASDGDESTVAFPTERDVWLTVRGGRSDGRSMKLRGRRFVIGRGPSCQLRVASPAVSRVHAVIERRGDRVYVRDLDSANGTRVDGRTLRGNEAEVSEGALIRFGPYCVEARRSSRGSEEPGAVPSVDEIIAGWLAVDRENGIDDQDAAERETIEDVRALPCSPLEPMILRHVVIENTLVVTPATPGLDDEENVRLLRETLRDFLTRPLPRRVVVNLEYVGRLSGEAIGVLAAYHLRLAREGGALRISQASPRLMAILDHIHLSALIDCLPTVDEAVLNAWSAPASPEGLGAVG